MRLFEKSSKVIPYIKGVEGKNKGHIAVLCTALSIEPPLFCLGFASTHVEQEISPYARPCPQYAGRLMYFGLY